jgi:hypothetical protein
VTSQRPHNFPSQKRLATELKMASEENFWKIFFQNFYVDEQALKIHADKNFAK